MNIDQLKSMIERDAKFDISELDQASIDTPYLHGKYINLYADENGKLKVMKFQLRKLKLFKQKYYSGKAEPEVYKEKPFHENLLNSEVPKYIDADDEIIDAETRIEMQQLKVDLIKDMCELLKARNWNIRNAIDFIRFKNGL